MPLSSI